MLLVSIRCYIEVRFESWSCLLPATWVGISLRISLSLLLHLWGASVKISWDHSHKSPDTRPGHGLVMQECSYRGSVTTHVWRKSHLKIFYNPISDSGSQFPWATPKLFLYNSLLLFMVLLSESSVTCDQPWSKNNKWEIPDINNS